MERVPVLAPKALSLTERAFQLLRLAIRVPQEVIVHLVPRLLFLLDVFCCL
jgi:hypothetical protein